MTQPLTDAINALTRYANETTGQSDTTLSDAVRTLCDGYGQGGGADISSVNLLDGTSLTPGYITTSGAMENPSATTLEYTTDYIDVSQYRGNNLVVACALEAGRMVNNYQWIAVSTYDDNHVWKKRTVISNYNNRTDYFANYYTVSNTDTYARVSFRSYGKCSIAMLKDSNAFPIMEAINATIVTSE